MVNVLNLPKIGTYEVGDIVTVPEYRKMGSLWEKVGRRKGRVVYVGPHFITVDWGTYRESLSLDDMTKRIYKGGTH